jgi:hypothetical protein
MGGIGLSSSITGTSVGRAGGGGGAGGNNVTGTASDGGGAGGADVKNSGTANTGGGGGGRVGFTNSGNGGSGVVILRYPDYYTISNPGGGLTFSTSTVGTDKVTTFTAGTGNIQFAD